MSEIYKCLCSRCHGKSKLLVIRTIEAHLLRDRKFHLTLPPSAVSAIFVQSCIEKTIEHLARIEEGLELPKMASESRPEGPGVSLTSVIT